MHHNENCNREYRRKADGSLWEKVTRKRVSHLNPTLSNPKESATFGKQNKLIYNLQPGLFEFDLVTTTAWQPTQVHVYIFAGYRDQLFTKLETHLVANTKPSLSDRTVPTLASTGPQLTRDQIKARKTTRGLKRKPHHLPVQDLEEEGSRRKTKRWQVINPKLQPHVTCHL